MALSQAHEPTSIGGPAASNRIDALANQLQQEGRGDELQRQLADFSPEELNAAERESWYHLRGIEPFRQGNRALALERFREAFAACPHSGMIAFSLGQELEHAGEIEEAFSLFDRFRFPKLPASFAMAQARYAYLWDRYEQGVSYVTPLLDAYWQLRVADDHFVYVRGLPFFSETWACLGAFYQLTDSLDELEKLTAAATRDLIEYDFSWLRRFVDGLRRGDLTDYVAEIVARSTQSQAQGLPSGYSTMQAAVLAAGAEPDVDRAERILDGVELRENDFPWLEDIRLLARTDLAHRRHDEEAETRLAQRFVRRQPLLFEPNQAFDFQLLGCQERLKEGYRRAKSRPQAD